MKKGFILFTALFLLSTFTAFAAVKAVKEGDVVKVTWTYENADAASVGLVGDFQAWNLAGALPMTKDANGVWTITLDGKADSEYSYKFNVDGEWTEDPTAPATIDDGFGGLNGKVIVADLLAAAAGAPAPSASAAKFTFSNYTSARFVAYSKGADQDKVGVEARVKSYWKILDAKLWQDISLKKLEVAVDDANYTLLDTTKTEEQFTPAEFLGWIITPFNSSNRMGRAPFNGHWSVAVATPVGEVASFYHYAKTPSYDKFYYEVYSGDMNGHGGFTQLEKKGLELAEGVKLDYLVGMGANVRRTIINGAGKAIWDGYAGPTGEWFWGTTGFWGTKSYADVTVADQTFGLMINTMSGVNQADNNFKDFAKDLSYEISVGAKGEALEKALSYKFQLVNHMYDGVDFKFAKHHAIGLNVGYKLGALKFTVDFADRGSGLEHNTFQHNGDDGDTTLHKNPADKSLIGFDVTYADDMMGFGLETDTKLESFLMETQPTNKTTELAVELNGFYNVSADIKAGAHAYLAYKADSDNTVKSAVNFKGFGLYSVLKNMGLPKITAGARVYMDNKHTEASTDDVMNISLLGQADLPDAMGVALGIGLIGGEVNKDAKDKFGLGLGFNKKFDGNGFAGPQFFTNFNLNMNMHDSWDEKYELELSEDLYIDGGRVSVAKYWNFATGFKWDF